MINNIENGKYKIDFAVYKQEADEPSAMHNYISKVALITKTEDSLTVTLLFQQQDIIKGFQIEVEAGNFSNAVDAHINPDKNFRHERFEIKNIQETLNARVQYAIEHEGKLIEGDQPLRLVFDLDSLSEIGL